MAMPAKKRTLTAEKGSRCCFEEPCPERMEETKPAADVFEADKACGKIVLYGGYPFRATRPLWLLEELGVPYEQKKVAIHASAPGLYVKSEEYLEVINTNAVIGANVCTRLTQMVWYRL